MGNISNFTTKLHTKFNYFLNNILMATIYRLVSFNNVLGGFDIENWLQHDSYVTLTLHRNKTLYKVNRFGSLQLRGPLQTSNTMVIQQLKNLCVWMLTKSYFMLRKVEIMSCPCLISLTRYSKNKCILCLLSLTQVRIPFLIGEIKINDIIFRCHPI